MAVGKFDFPEMEVVAGVQLGTACAGIKQQERDDLLLVELPHDAVCSAVFTQNAFCAAPITIARQNIDNQPRWLLVNSGNANAGTGIQGMDDASDTCRILAQLTDCSESQVMPFSTGVIGERLPVDKFKNAIPIALANLSEQGWQAAGQAIMTTDTRAKGASKRFELGGRPVVINGIAKGAGMIHPNMATMLSFIATDARVDQQVLDRCLTKAVDQSFNCISVDGDTSTNDACVLIAAGSEEKPIVENETDISIFETALQEVCDVLSESIIRDGEGATKLIRVVVEEARSDQEARKTAYAIATSSLVKTAFFASDPNWGRILAAVGRAGLEDFDIDQVAIWLDGVQIVSGGCVALSYTEIDGQNVMSQDEIQVKVQLGRGSCSTRILSCDLSYDYVKINSDYRT